MKEQKLAILQELKSRKDSRPDGRLIETFYPDEGPLRRELYPKHIHAFELGLTERGRAVIAGNRIGKSTSIGGYEMTWHLLGEYPEWWPGRRFNRPTDCWAAGDTSQTTRDIIQQILLGPPEAWGSGLIPAERIHSIKRKGGGIPDAVESIAVKTKDSNGLSVLGLKSYDQKRKSFQGTKKDFIWLDEEPPWLVYEECLLRITDTSGGAEGGLMLGTFTPLQGMSTVVLYFIGGVEQEDGTTSEGLPNSVVRIGMKEVPHISDEEREKILSKLPPHQRKAREDGIPALGAGAIYPIDIETVLFDPREQWPNGYPTHWPQGYGMDVGWNATAAAFMHYDRDNDCLYLTNEYKAGKQVPAIHASAIKARGADLPGVIDPASKGHSPNDGERLVKLYTQEGLRLELAERQQREAGLLECLNRFTTGRLWIARHCVKTQAEMGLYRRDEKGAVVKVNDHLMDAMRYRVLQPESMRIMRRRSHVRTIHARSTRR